MGRQTNFGHILKDQMLKSKVEKTNAFIESLGQFNKYALNESFFEGKDTLIYVDYETGVTFRFSNMHLKNESHIEITINREDNFNVLDLFKKTIQVYDETRYQVHSSYYDGERYFVKDENGEYNKLIRRVDKYGACYEFPEDKPEYIGTLKSKRQAVIDTVGVVFNSEDHNREIVKWYDFENEFGLNESVHITQFKNGDRLVKSLYLGFTGRDYESTKYISNEVVVFSQTKYKFNDEIVEVYESTDSAFCKIYTKGTDNTYTCYYNDNNKYAVYKVDENFNPISYSSVGYKFKDSNDSEDFIFIRDLYGIPTKVVKEVEK